MTTVIETLSQMASDASIQNSQDIEQLLSDNKIDEDIIQSILAKDVTSLERQLDVCPDIVCILAPAEDDEPEEESEQEEESNSINLVING
jgi:hypothetical protein